MHRNGSEVVKKSPPPPPPPTTTKFSNAIIYSTSNPPLPPLPPPPKKKSFHNRRLFTCLFVCLEPCEIIVNVHRHGCAPGAILTGWKWDIITCIYIYLSELFDTVYSCAVFFTVIITDKIQRDHPSVAAVLHSYYIWIYLIRAGICYVLF